jgi:uncharacterized protein (UPF0335 family)
MASKGKVGRPKKEIAFDPSEVAAFIQRWFQIEQEIKTLREAKGDLKDEFGDKVDMKLIASVVRLVKAELKINVSEETKVQLEDIIKDKIGMILS